MIRCVDSHSSFDIFAFMREKKPNFVNLLYSDNDNSLLLNNSLIPTGVYSVEYIRKTSKHVNNVNSLLPTLNKL